MKDFSFFKMKSLIYYLFLIHCKSSTPMAISPYSQVRQILHPALLLGVAVHPGAGLPAAARGIPIMPMTSQQLRGAGAVIPSIITMATSQQHRVTISRDRT